MRKAYFVNKIYWNELKGKDLINLFLSVLKRLPTPRVYLSIDKDCLRNQYALTNWEEGMLSLEELLWMLKLIMDHVDIIGMDIVGDYSEVSVHGKLKKFISYLDHPEDHEDKISIRCFCQRNKRKDKSQHLRTSQRIAFGRPVINLLIYLKSNLNLPPSKKYW